MNIRASVLVGTLFFCTAMSMAAETVEVFIKTTGQGQIMGSSLKRGREKWIEIQGIAGIVAPRDIQSGQSSGKREIQAPRDAQSGLATGKRMHSDITISKYSDKASALLMRALCSNEVVTECMIAITGDDGKTRMATLSGVTMDEILVKHGMGGGPATEEVSFTYQKITWTYKE